MGSSCTLLLLLLLGQGWRSTVNTLQRPLLEGGDRYVHQHGGHFSPHKALLVPPRSRILQRGRSSGMPLARFSPPPPNVRHRTWLHPFSMKLGRCSNHSNLSLTLETLFASYPVTRAIVAR